MALRSGNALAMRFTSFSSHLPFSSPLHLCYLLTCEVSRWKSDELQHTEVGAGDHPFVSEMVGGANLNLVQRLRNQSAC